MAFIREYSMEGDPFLGRAFKKLRKVKFGRFLGKAVKAPFRIAAKVAPFAAGFIPGGGLLSGLAGRLFSIAEKYGIPAETATEFARSYGLDIGDPDDESGMGMSGYMGDDDLGLDFMGDPGRGGPAPKPARKRKTAGAGPRVKAQKKDAKRRERAGRRRGESFGSKLKRGLGKFDPSVLGSALEFATRAGLAGKDARDAAFAGSAEDAALAEMAAAIGGAKKGKGVPGDGSKRRTMNPSNVRALRRSIRRVEGFQTLVKRIHKAFPALRGPTTIRSSPRRARGHRAGCGCVVCRRAA